jgi:hypothetical protein
MSLYTAAIINMGDEADERRIGGLTTRLRIYVGIREAMGRLCRCTGIMDLGYWSISLSSASHWRDHKDSAKALGALRSRSPQRERFGTKTSRLLICREQVLHGHFQFLSVQTCDFIAPMSVRVRVYIPHRPGCPCHHQLGARARLIDDLELRIQGRNCVCFCYLAQSTPFPLVRK